MRVALVMYYMVKYSVVFWKSYIPPIFCGENKKDFIPLLTGSKTQVKPPPQDSEKSRKIGVETRP